jgi:hypothetical protein
MPKKNTTTRGAAQRNRARVQKSIELVRPASALQAQEEQTSSDTAANTDQVAAAISTSTIESETPVKQKPARVAKGNDNGHGNANGNGILATPGVTLRRTRGAGAALATSSSAKKSEEPADEEDTLVTASPAAAPAPAAAAVTSAPKGSAAARIAARRQAAQKSQQRSLISLITPEHYAYVRKDLRFILILAIIMFAVIIALHFALPALFPGIGY